MLYRQLVGFSHKFLELDLLCFMLYEHQKFLSYLKSRIEVVGKELAVYNQWTRLLEWTTGMGYWTDLFCTKNYFYGL